MSVANDTAPHVARDPAETSSTRVRRPLRQRLRLPLMLAAPVVIALAVGYVYLTGGRVVSTDDAYVQAARVSISTDVPGRVVQVAVHDNETVRQGQLLFRLDDRPFRIAVENAKAALAGARLKVESLKSTYRQRQADLAVAQETLAYQQREYDRQKQLLASHVASQAQFDQARHAYDNARRQVEVAQQQVAGALADLGGNPGIPTDQHPLVQQAQAELDRAQLNLSYTIVRAPEDGVVTRVDQLQAGDYINAATPTFALVATHRLWIEANFKETALTHMRSGQPATVSVDTYPDKVFRARVATLSPGTGSSFSLLPPQNATGNWVKVVQRLPVRIVLDQLDPSRPLHAGLSVSVDVDTGYQRPLLRTIARFLGLAPSTPGEPG